MNRRIQSEAAITDSEAPASVSSRLSTALRSKTSSVCQPMALRMPTSRRRSVEPKPLAAPVTLESVLSGTVDAWVAPSEDSPPVRKARVALDVAKLETDKARAGHLPTVDFAASYGRGHNGTNGSQLSTSGPSAGSMLPFDISGPVTQSSIGVTLKLPLFAGFSVQNRVKETLLLEEQSRNNFAMWKLFVVPGNPMKSTLLIHPLAEDAGGDRFHAGGKHWKSQSDPEWQILAA